MAWVPPEPVASLAQLRRDGAPPALLASAESGIFSPMPAPGPSDWLNGPGEKDRKGQSYREWRQKGVTVKGAIYLVPVGPVDVDAAVLEQTVAAFYAGVPVRLAPALPEAALERATGRGSRGFGPQLRTTDLHEELDAVKQSLPDAWIVMAFTSYDLYPRESWNFVFGQARPAKGTGVFSFARYRCISKAKFLRRCMMVLTHEIGHLFGLAHCVYWHCCMNGSNHDAEADARPFGLCPCCLAKVSSLLPARLDDRERMIVQVLEKVGLEDLARWHAEHLCLLERHCGPRRAARAQGRRDGSASRGGAPGEARRAGPAPGRRPGARHDRPLGAA